MAADSYSLLQFILDLLRDGDEAEDFAKDPQGTLEKHGLDGICLDDVRDVAPYVLDYTPVAHAFGGKHHDGGGKDHDRDHGDRDHDRDHGRDHGEHDDHEDVVREITKILNNYTYNIDIDDRDTTFDQSVHQAIFAKGDVKQSFDYDTTVASGDGAVAAGDDVNGAATGDGAVAAGDDINGDVVTGDGSFIGNGNDVANGDNNIVGENEVGNTEVEVEIEDSFQDNSTTDSHDDNSDNSTNVDISDSLNDNEIGNTETEVDVDIEDVAVAFDDAIAAVVEDNEVTV